MHVSKQDREIAFGGPRRPALPASRVMSHQIVVPLRKAENERLTVRFHHCLVTPSLARTGPSTSKAFGKRSKGESERAQNNTSTRNTREPSLIGAMSATGNDSDTGTAAKKLRHLSEVEGTVGASVDLVAAARKHVSFLRTVAESQWLHHKPVLTEAVRRYEDLWMPLISGLTNGSMQPLVLPPIDVEWVWYCHTLNPVGYRQYCKSRFSKLIGKQTIFDVENEEYAMMRCREIWIRTYPSEPFENELDSESQNPKITNEYLLNQVMKQRFLCSKFAEPYMSENVYLIAAKQRYKGFLYLLKRFTDGSCSRLIPALDILLMCLTHQMASIRQLAVGVEYGSTLARHSTLPFCLPCVDCCISLLL